MLRALDLFAGAGGASEGLRQAGFDVLAAVENDHSAANSYRANHPEVVLKEQDIRDVEVVALRRELKLRTGSLELLKACPPCQGFSTLSRGNIDEERNDLVLDIVRFVNAFRPKIILLENVRGLQRDKRLTTFCETLQSSLKYRFKQYKVDALDFGVPQRRKRLIVLGISSSVRRCLPCELVSPDPARQIVTVGEALRDVDESTYGNDPLNRYRRLHEMTQSRVAAIPVNGTRFDLPDDLSLDCHKKIVNSGLGRNATASYGRLRLGSPAPTMTTRCTTPACGSFIHPTRDRGITLREAATLQTFPVDYQFHGNYGAIERQIGNAVPVRMARQLGMIAAALCGRP